MVSHSFGIKVTLRVDLALRDRDYRSWLMALGTCTPLRCHREEVGGRGPAAVLTALFL